MLTLAEIRARKKSPQAEVRFVLDPEWGARFSELENRAAQVSGDQADEVNEQLEKLRAEADDNMVVFKLRGISADRYERIVALHPPTKKQRDKAREAGEGGRAWNEDTFPPALVAACCAEPEMSEADAKELWADDNWTRADLSDLFHVALGCCVYRATPPTVPTLP